MKISKIIVATCVAATLSIGMFGCSGGSSSSSSEASSAQSSSSQAEQASKSDAKYECTIDGCEVTTDYAGKPAAVITYTWTNNADDAQMFSVAINADVYQNGTELSPAIVSGMETDSMNKIKPGTTQTVKQAYSLDDTSEISVEVKETFSFGDELLAEKSFQVS